MLTNVLRTMHFSMGLQKFGAVEAKIIVTAVNVYKGVGKQTIHLEQDLLEEQNSYSFKSYLHHDLDSVKEIQDDIWKFQSRLSGIGKNQTLESQAER